MSALVRVVVPTRNRVELLRSTLHAILEQREVDLEVVVVDEGSSDGTQSYLASLDDPRLRTVRHDLPRGTAGARNAGLSGATAPWVAFCDDDDVWAPDKLRAQLDEAARAPRCRWVACGAVLVDPDLRVVDHQRPGAPGDVVARLCRGNDIPGGGSGVLAQRSLVEEAGGFREDQHNGEDWDLWVRCAVLSPLAVVDRPLVAYRIWAGSMSRAAGPMLTAFDTITTRYRHLATERGAEPDVVAHRRYLAKQLLRDGHGRAAAALFAEAARVQGGFAAWARVPLAAAAPRWVAQVGDRRARARVPVSWVREAEPWLAAARAAQPPG